MSELGLNVEGGRLSGIDSWNFVEEICQPHEVGVVRQVESPHGIVDNLVADIDFFGKSFFREVEKRTANSEIFVEAVLQVKTKEGLALSVESELLVQP